MSKPIFEGKAGDAALYGAAVAKAVAELPKASVGMGRFLGVCGDYEFYVFAESDEDAFAMVKDIAAAIFRGWESGQ